MTGRSGAVDVQCAVGDHNCIAEFDLGLMQMQRKQMEPPGRQFRVIRKLRSTAFQKIRRHLENFGQTLQLRARKEKHNPCTEWQLDVGSGSAKL